jgi:hypothetical protein
VTLLLSSTKPPTIFSEARFASRFRWLPVAASILVISTGLLVLAGWIFHLPGLHAFHHLIAYMPPYPAFCFVLSGIALAIMQTKSDGWIRSGARLCAIIVVIMSLFSVAFQLLAWRLTNGAATRLLMLTSMQILCLGFALLVLDMQVRSIRPSKWLSIGVIITVLSTLVVSVINPQPLAFHTELALLVLSVGILAAGVARVPAWGDRPEVKRPQSSVPK